MARYMRCTDFQASMDHDRQLEGHRISDVKPVAIRLAHVAITISLIIMTVCWPMTV